MLTTTLKVLSSFRCENMRPFSRKHYCIRVVALNKNVKKYLFKSFDRGMKIKDLEIEILSAIMIAKRTN